jgi:hypothetical protein
MKIFSVQVIQKHGNTPQPPTGAGLAQGGRSYRMKQIFAEQKGVFLS